MAFSLSDLADKHGTDKRLREHAYVIQYEKLMESKRLSAKRVLEIGFGKGASVKMWQEYFTNAEIYCMEYFDEEYNKLWQKPSTDIPRIVVLPGDSTKSLSWEKLPTDFDFIIDDGSHFPNDQIETFKNGLYHLKSHGLYFIEDTHCGFEKKYGGNADLYNWAFDLILNQQVKEINSYGDFYKIRNIIQGIAKDIFAYSFYKSMIVIERA